jgi:hypothetical protein
MKPKTIDATELLAQIEHLSDSAAARICNVDRTTIRRWRLTGQASPGVLADTLEHLANPTDTPPVPRPRGNPTMRHMKHQPAQIHAHATWTEHGWILDAYRIDPDNPDVIDPLTSTALVAATGQRWPTLHDAHAYARRRFGRRLALLTPAPIDQEATA